ncbi:MAG: hypothetical protein H3C47_16145 [Candidatus Cloacimonetes bacterium]|nr:hypothetical protein [Candidatus Cloacimonadota bacterium]
MRIGTGLTVPALRSSFQTQQSQLGSMQSIERLSSGLKINRGADDAAGLTISEKLRGQIRGLNRAITNSLDSISMAQTADAAVQENQAMLNRLRELTIQAQDGALTRTDRLEIQKEVDQLVNEIDSIAETTEFNTRKLLDGSSGYRATLDRQRFELYHMGGNTSSTISGKIEANLRLDHLGQRQELKSTILQSSHILTTASTKLKELDTLQSFEAQAALSSGVELLLKGRNRSTAVRIDGEMSLGEMGQLMERAMQTDLGMQKSEVEFVQSWGQFWVKSGAAGADGEFYITGNDAIIDGLGFSTTKQSENSSYTVHASTGSFISDSHGGNAEIGDMQLRFANLEGASIRTTNGLPVIRIIETSRFTIADTNVHGLIGPAAIQDMVSSGYSQPLQISIASGSYTFDQIVNTINTQIDSTAQSPRIRASHNGNVFELKTLDTGTTALISIVADFNTTNYLGFKTGRYEGSGGSPPTLVNPRDFTNGFTVQDPHRRVRLLFSTADGEYDQVRLESPIYPLGLYLSQDMLVSIYNGVFDTQANGLIRADINSSGRLVFQASAEMGTGQDSRFFLVDEDGSDFTFQIPHTTAVSGFFPGNPAVLIGSPSNSSRDMGYQLEGMVNFFVTDGEGNRSDNIVFSGENLLSIGQPYILAKSQIISIMDNANMGHVKVGYRFDELGRFELFSTDYGQNARVILTALDSDSDIRAQKAFGISFNSQDQGVGEKEFRAHLNRRVLNFQIGANRGQSVEIAVGDLRAKALNLDGLDVSTNELATISLGRIDRAVLTMSSTRANLGAFQQRMELLFDNLTTYSVNLTSTESKIRDADVALETVALTRERILSESSISGLQSVRQNASYILQLL